MTPDPVQAWVHVVHMARSYAALLTTQALQLDLVPCTAHQLTWVSVQSSCFDG